MGDMSTDIAPTFRDPLSHWSLGGGVEYTINPMFSIGLGYTFHRLAHADTRGSFESRVHNTYPFIGVNLLNHALFRRNHKWDLWLTVGMGRAFYTSNLTYLGIDDKRPDNMSDEAWDKIVNVTNTSSAGVVPLGIELSYDITRQLTIALKAKYFLYSSDDLEGSPKKLPELGNDIYGRKNYTFAGSSNDMAASFGLSLRWNIAGKDRTHMRNLTWEDYIQEQQEVDLSGILVRLDSLENRVDNIGQDVHTLIHYPSSTIVVEESVDVLLNPIFIFFDFDRYDLRHEALAQILTIATLLNEHQDLNIDIVGFTDIRGSTAYNVALSQRRANAVKNELVNIWGISPDRITHEGRGKAIVPQPTMERYFSINRRTEVRFYRR
jgi:outer membrane protein OmpA-like peptidoglycan-associated protein